MPQHICTKTAFDRQKKGCSKARMLAVDEVFEGGVGGRNIADSEQAMRILKGCEGTLDEDDMTLIIDMLEKSNKLTNTEAIAAKEALKGDTAQTGVEEALAADRAFRDRHQPMFPHADRLHGNNGRVDSKAQAAFDAKFGCGHIKTDPYPSTPYGYGDNPNVRSDQAAWAKRMFPHEGRLK